MKFRKIRMLVRFLTCFLILAAVAVQRNGSLFGHDIKASVTTNATESGKVEPVQSIDGATVVNTTTLTKDIKGYGGSVPLKISIADGKISNIEVLKNSESEDFFLRVREEMIPKWIGTPVEDVASKNVDAISGATMSSNAVNANVKEGVAYVLGHPVADNNSSELQFSWEYLAVLLVVLCAGIIPLFVKNKYYRCAQLILNVIVLGFWSGTFLSYELFINYISNGVNVWTSLALLLMLVIAFAYPYFGKMTYYCTWVCPLGSLQELCGKCVKYKIQLSSKTVKILNIFQECLWFGLIFLMAAGIWSDWISYELFKAFIFESAAVGVLIATGIVVVLSFVVQRPYCRFICPTGCLFHITQNPEK